MKKYKDLLKNVGVLVISSFATKLLSFFLVPLYTSILSTAEYGLYDLFSTAMNLLFPVLTLCIQDAVLRYSMDPVHNKKEVLSIGLGIHVLSSVIIGLFLIINHCWIHIVSLDQYAFFFLTMYIFAGLVAIFNSFARSIDRIKEISIAAVLSTATGLTCNILFLTYFKLGLVGYFWASLLSSFVTIVFISIRIKIFDYIILSGIRLKIVISMITYSSPLVLNAIGGWVNNASDRYIVIKYLLF